MQPERNIEKLLHAFARKRRDPAGARFDPHPATRRMLQGEVARRFPQRACKRKLWWRSWPSLWPRLAFATGTLALLALGTLMLFPPGAGRTGHPLTLAQQASSKATGEVEAPTSPAVSPAPPAGAAPRGPTHKPAVVADRTMARAKVVEPDVGTGMDAKAVPGRERQIASAPTVPPASVSLSPRAAAAERSLAALATRASEHQPSEDMRHKSDLRGKPALAETKTDTPVPFGRLAADSSFVDPRTDRVEAQSAPGTADNNNIRLSKAQADSHYFARKREAEASYGLAARGATTVLQSFHLEQSGVDIRIVDADGSVYTGTIQLGNNTALPIAASPPRTVATRLSKAKETVYSTGQARSGGAQEDSAQTLNFVVRGTNTTLRQGIEFAGHLQPAALVQQAATSNEMIRATQRFQNQFGVSGVIPRPQLSGRLRLEGGAEAEIHAVPLPADTAP